jgi:hypothetical protein
MGKPPSNLITLLLGRSVANALHITSTVTVALHHFTPHMPSNVEVGSLLIAPHPPTTYPTHGHHHLIANFVKFCIVCLITFSQFGKLVKEIIN